MWLLSVFYGHLQLYFYYFLSHNLAFTLLWIIVTCQNLQVCSFNGLSVCVHIDTGRSFWPINTKFGAHMESGPWHRLILFIGQKSNNKVTRSKSRSKFKIIITPPIFKLERQNIGISMAYLGVGPMFWYNFRFERLPGPQNGGHFEIF